MHHITFWVRDALSFLFRSSKLSQLYHHGDPSNHCKSSPCVFNFSFISIDHSFVTGVLHGGSTWWFIKDLIPSRSVHWDSFQRSSSFLHLANPECNCSPLSFEVVIYHSSFTRMRYLNQSLSSMELSWYKFHLKPSIGNVALCGDYLWSKFYPYHLGGRKISIFS